jgi:hypothetical protein
VLSGALCRRRQAVIWASRVTGPTSANPKRRAKTSAWQRGTGALGPAGCLHHRIGRGGKVGNGRPRASTSTQSSHLLTQRRPFQAEAANLSSSSCRPARAGVGHRNLQKRRLGCANSKYGRGELGLFVASFSRITRQFAVEFGDPGPMATRSPWDRIHCRWFLRCFWSDCCRGRTAQGRDGRRS